MVSTCIRLIMSGDCVHKPNLPKKGNGASCWYHLHAYRPEEMNCVRHM